MGRYVLLSSLPLMALFTACRGSSGSTVDELDAKDTVRAQRFIVVDESGNEHAEFGISDNGQTRLVVRNAKNGMYAWMGVEDDGLPCIALVDGNGIVRAELGMLGENEPYLLLRDQDNKPRLGAKLCNDGRPVVALHSAQGKAQLTLLVDQKDLPQISLKDGKSKRVTIDVFEDGQCGIALFDSKQRMRLGLSVADTCQVISAIDEEGEIFAIFPTDTPLAREGGERATEPKDRDVTSPP